MRECSAMTISFRTQSTAASTAPLKPRGRWPVCRVFCNWRPAIHIIRKTRTAASSMKYDVLGRGKVERHRTDVNVRPPRQMNRGVVERKVDAGSSSIGGMMQHHLADVWAPVPATDRASSCTAQLQYEQGDEHPEISQRRRQRRKQFPVEQHGNGQQDHATESERRAPQPARGERGARRRRPERQPVRNYLDGESQQSERPRRNRRALRRTTAPRSPMTSATSAAPGASRLTRPCPCGPSQGTAITLRYTE